MPQIRAIFFDLYGTLAHFHPPREQIQTRAAAEHGIHLVENGIRRGYQRADEFMAHQNERAPLRTMSREERERFFARYEQLILEGAGREVDIDTAAAIWGTVRKQQYGLALYGDVLSTLEVLRAKGRTLAALSNLNEPGQSVLQRIGLAGHVEFAITSGEIGAEKPDPRMFQAALTKAAVEPHQVVHVGDQLSSDIEGAKAAGIRPILMDRDRRYPDFSEELRAEDMPQVADLVARLESPNSGDGL